MAKPPPLMGCKACGNQMSHKAPVCQKCGHPNRASKNLSGGQILPGLAVGVWAIWFMAESGLSESVTASTTDSQSAISNLQLENVHWRTEGFGAVMMLDAMLTNKGTRTVKDVKLECGGYAKSGTKIDTNAKVVYDTFPVTKARLIENFNMGFINSQVTSAKCGVVDATLL